MAPMLWFIWSLRWEGTQGEGRPLRPEFGASGACTQHLRFPILKTTTDTDMYIANTHMYICVYTHMYINVHRQTDRQERVYIYMYIHTHVNTYTCYIYIYIYIHVYIYMYTYCTTENRRVFGTLALAFQRLHQFACSKVTSALSQSSPDVLLVIWRW